MSSKSESIDTYCGSAPVAQTATLHSFFAPDLKITQSSSILSTTSLGITSILWIFNFRCTSAIVAAGCPYRHVSRFETIETLISWLKRRDQRFLYPNASSVPAAPDPHTTTLGTILFSTRYFSLASNVASRLLIGLVARLRSITPGTVLALLVFEPTLTTSRS